MPKTCSRNQDEDKGIWFQNLLTLQPGGSSSVRFTGTRYFWTVKTHGPNPTSFDLGWIEPRKINGRSQSAKLVIDGQTVQEQREFTYTEAMAITETVQEQYTVMVPYFRDGKLESVPETRTRDQQVTKMVPHDRKATATVEVFRLNGMARVGDEPLFSDVTFRTSKAGAFIRYHLAGEDRVYIAPNPTTSTKQLGIGIYVIWTERDGKVTSQKYSYDVFDEKMEITIAER